MGANAAAGAAGSVAQSAGATADQAALISLGLSGGLIRSAAGRQFLRDTAEQDMVNRLAPAVTSDTDAAASALRSKAMLDQAKAAAPQATPAALASSVTGQLTGGLNAADAML